jgi:guanine deaminase
MPKDNLLLWLKNYTWPYENKFKNVIFSKKKAKSFALELAQSGTIGGACYASIHPHTVDHAIESFQGHFIVGNVLMTMNSPNYLTQTKENALKTVKTLSKKYRDKYALTPRFAPTTHPEVMKKGSNLILKNKSFIQTHLSETTNEIEYVLDIYRQFTNFKKIDSYTDIYDQCDILGPKTIMGHGIYLSKNELLKLKKTKTAIAHCPSSNAPTSELGLGSGLFDFKNADRYKIPWALASDIGGGPNLSMFDVMRSFVSQNKKIKNSKATYTRAIYRSTIMGAKILGIENEVGEIKKNREASFIFVELAPKNKCLRAEDFLKKIIEANKKNRAEYKNLVFETVYKGKPIYSKISNKTGQ